MARRAGGASVSDHYAAVARQTGRVRETRAPDMPDGVRHLWRAFCELNAARGSTGFGPSPIGFADIEAWCRLTRTRLDPWEVRAIRSVDEVVLEAAAATDGGTG